MDSKILKILIVITFQPFDISYSNFGIMIICILVILNIENIPTFEVLGLHGLNVEKYHFCAFKILETICYLLDNHFTVKLHLLLKLN